MVMRESAVERGGQGVSGVGVGVALDSAENFSCFFFSRVFHPIQNCLSVQLILVTVSSMMLM